MIATENLSKNYGDIVVLNNLNLKVPKKEGTALLDNNRKKRMKRRGLYC